MCNYFRLDVLVDNFRCKQFIIKKKDNKIFSQMKVKLKDIKLKMINNQNYLEIKDYIIIDGNKIVDIGKLKLFTFNLPEIQDNLLNIGKTKFISKKIKVKEII